MIGRMNFNATLDFGPLGNGSEKRRLPYFLCPVKGKKEIGVEKSRGSTKTGFDRPNPPLTSSNVPAHHQKHVSNQSSAGKQTLKTNPCGQDGQSRWRRQRWKRGSKALAGPRDPSNPRHQPQKTPSLTFHGFASCPKDDQNYLAAVRRTHCG